jgi:hypothetical protein
LDVGRDDVGGWREIEGRGKRLREGMASRRSPVSKARPEDPRLRVVEYEHAYAHLYPSDPYPLPVRI